MTAPLTGNDGHQAGVRPPFFVVPSAPPRRQPREEWLVVARRRVVRGAEVLDGDVLQPFEPFNPGGVGLGHGRGDLQVEQRRRGVLRHAPAAEPKRLDPTKSHGMKCFMDMIPSS